MKTRSFLDLFITENLDIEIPMLQRDYAQGREDAKTQRIRERFLDTLTAALEDKPVILDFIYGSAQDGKFYPLDGQQRLTALFLLHGYIAAREEQGQDFLRRLSRGGKSRFSYTTRFSSRDFCDKFVDCLVGENLLLKGPAGQSLRSWIEDQSWFLYSWHSDPTIRSMLVMLDAIHECLKDKQGKQGEQKCFWPRLTGEDGKPAAIQFHLLELGEFHLSDELYIQMNARGKPLTEFENFKAYFLGLLEEIDATRLQEFSQRFDNAWTDIFWAFWALSLSEREKQKRKEEAPDVDSLFLRYIRYLTDLSRWLFSSEASEVSADAKQEDEKQDIFKLCKAVYGDGGKRGREARDWLFRALDCWYVWDDKNIDPPKGAPRDIPALFGEIFAPAGYEAGKICLNNKKDIDLFSRCCREYEYGSGNFSLGDSLLLYAVLHQLIFAGADFSARLRSVRNLIWNLDSVRREEMPRLLSAVKKIMEGGVLQESEFFAPFTEYQIKEEQAKAEFLEKNPEHRETVCQLEDHPLLRGRLAVLFNADEKKFNVEPHQALTFLRLFPRNAKEQPSRAQAARALLTVEDYTQALSYGRWQFGPGNSGHETFWQDLFTRQERDEFEDTKNCLCDLLKKVTSENGNIMTCLENRIKKYLENTEKEKKFDWRYYFVKYYDTMCAGKTGIYYAGSKSGFFDISMLETTRRSGYYRDPYLWTIVNKVSSCFKEVSLFKKDEKDEPRELDPEVIGNIWSAGRDKNWMRLVQAGVEMYCDPKGKGFLLKAVNPAGQERLDALRQNDKWKGKIEDWKGTVKDREETVLLVTVSGNVTEKEIYDTEDRYDAEDRIEIGASLVRHLLES